MKKLSKIQLKTNAKPAPNINSSGVKVVPKASIGVKNREPILEKTVMMLCPMLMISSNID